MAKSGTSAQGKKTPGKKTAGTSRRAAATASRGGARGRGGKKKSTAVTKGNGKKTSTAVTKRRSDGVTKGNGKKTAARKKTTGKKTTGRARLREPRKVRGEAILTGSAKVPVLLNGAQTFGIPARFALLSIPGYNAIATRENCWFDCDAADKKVAFFAECLSFTCAQWSAMPFILELWQRAWVENLFGWKRPNGTRRYRESLGYVPRKNGKTELAGGFGITLGVADGEPAAQVYCAAADRDQAKFVFTAARRMVEADDALHQRSKPYTNSIVFHESGSSLKCISAEAYSKHGMNAHGIIIDELHAQPNRDLVDVLTTSTGARRQPLVILITTADFDRESICNEKYLYACSVRDGSNDPDGFRDVSFLPVIYEALPDDDWTDPDVWRKANPNLGVSVSMEYMETECKKAQATPTYENTFKRLHLNLRTQQDVRWLPMAKWDACAGVEVDAEALIGQECFGGLDLASTTDITAFSLVFRASDGSVKVLPYFWIPQEGMREREKRDRVPYEVWVRQGLVEVTPGNVLDYDRVRERINELGELYNIREIAFDRWNATQLSTQLDGDGFTMVKFGQGFHDMSAPSKELERLIISGQLYHGGNPVLRWMADNAAAETDAAGNVKPSKKKSTQKIDGIVATVMGLGRSMLMPELKPSVYERDDVTI